MSSARRSHDLKGSASVDSLVAAWRDDRDEQARTELIERFLPLARKLASRYARGGESSDDLVQVASVGLIKAVERFDPDNGASLASFAIPTILGELKRHFRDASWSVQVDRRSQDRARAVIAAERTLTALGRSPTVDELAAYLECAPEEVLEGMQASLAYSAVSLDAPTATGDGGAGTDTTLGDTVGRADAQLELVDDRATLNAAVQHLPKLERRILYLRFSADMSQREIATRVGISQMHVSRLLRSSLSRLREQIGESTAAA